MSAPRRNEVYVSRSPQRVSVRFADPALTLIETFEAAGPTAVVEAGRVVVDG